MRSKLFPLTWKAPSCLILACVSSLCLPPWEAFLSLAVPSHSCLSCSLLPQGSQQLLLPLHGWFNFISWTPFNLRTSCECFPRGSLLWPCYIISPLRAISRRVHACPTLCYICHRAGAHAVCDDFISTCVLICSERPRRAGTRLP